MSPEEFENGLRGFILKTHQMFSGQEYKNATITGHFGFVFKPSWICV